MVSFRGLGIGLSLGFGFILMGIVGAEVLRLRWRKRSIYSSNRSKTHKYFSFSLCWKRPDSDVISSQLELTNSVRNHQVEVVRVEEDVEKGSSKLDYGEESELMMSMNNLCGPPRFLFTIKEESTEDLESARSSNCKGFNGIGGVDGIGTPPLPSPDFKGSNLRDRNRVLESLTEEEMNRLRTSPPPTFKFLKDAEDKFMLMQEAERKRGLVMNEGLVRECGVSKGTAN